MKQSTKHLTKLFRSELLLRTDEQIGNIIGTCLYTVNGIVEYADSVPHWIELLGYQTRPGESEEGFDELVAPEPSALRTTLMNMPLKEFDKITDLAFFAMEYAYREHGDSLPGADIMSKVKEISERQKPGVQQVGDHHMVIGQLFEPIKADILADQDYRDLMQKLLTMGGSALVYRPSSSRLIRHIIDNGLLFKEMPVKQVKGESGHCHDNVEALWAKHKQKYTKMYGYALSDDGLWREHGWLLEGNTIIETTELRVAYYGFALSDDDKELQEEE